MAPFEAVRTFRRLPRERKADALLVASAGLIAFVLGLWLIYWLLFVKPLVYFASGPLAGAPTAAASVAALSQEAGSREIGSLVARRFGTESVAPPPRDGRTIRDYLNEHDDRPLILYVGSLLVSSLPREADSASSETEWPDPRRFVLPLEPRTSAEQALVSTLAEIDGRPKGASKVLIVLDPGDSEADPVLGLYGDPAVDRLKAATARLTGVRILCARGPGQAAGSNRDDGRTIFGRNLAKALLRARDVDQLIDMVRAGVAEEAARTSQAVQVPLDLGDPTVNFDLPAPGSKSATPSASSADLSEARGRLAELHKARDSHALRHPVMISPAAWRFHGEALVRAERLLRAGRRVEFAQALDQVRAAEAALATPELARPGSLALALQSPQPGIRSAAVQSSADLRSAAIRAIEANRVPPPPPLPPPAPGPNDPKVPPQPPEPVGLVAIHRASNPWADVVEGQALEAARVFASRVPKSSESFARGARGEALARACLVRLRCEEAAAVLWPFARLNALVDRADAQRRIGEDLLFIGDDQARDALPRFDEAEALLAEAEQFRKAVELTGEVAAELPFLGRWKARHDAIRGEATPLEFFTDLVDETRGLLDALDAEGDSWKPRAGTLAVKWKTLVNEFQETLNRESLSYREIDALLQVPSIPAPRRAALLDLARGVKPAPPEAPAAPSPESSKPSSGAKLADAGRELMGGQVSRQTILEVGAAVRGEPEAEEESDAGSILAAPPPSESRADPVVTATSLGLARLERALLCLSGTLDGRFAAFDAALRTASSAVPVDHTPEVARLRDELFRRLLAQTEVTPNGETTWKLECAWATLPPHLQPTSLRDRRKKTRHASWVRLAARQAEDFCPDRAEPYLNAARAVPDDLSKLEKRIAEERNCLALEAAVEGDRRLGIQGAELAIRVTDKGAAPAGQAVVIHDVGEGRPIKVSREASAATLGSTSSAGAIRVMVRRDDFRDKSTRSVELRPFLFYRGRLIPAAGPVEFTLEPIARRLDVTIATDPAVLGNRTDQFTKHRGECYIYPNASHTYILKVGLPPDAGSALNVRVDRVFGGKPLEPIRGLVEPGRELTVPGREVSAAELNPEKPTPLEVSVLLDQPDGPLLARESFTFHQVKPERYFDIYHRFNNNEMTVEVTRREDRIVVDLGLAVGISAGELIEVRRNGRPWTTPAPFPIKHNERYQFVFRIGTGSRSPAPIRYWVSVNDHAIERTVSAPASPPPNPPPEQQPQAP